MAANQGVIQGSVAARVLDCHAKEHANAVVVRRAATKIMPILSETKNSKMYGTVKWLSIFEFFIYLFIIYLFIFYI